ncbi:TetR/AcrR family transcriptional regulator [Micromonospora echinofusca]|uniref:TetR family transcriptional regulator n=1 Tax=Micromonospora echinofusca TaxID=47858 RepID=A0ABS3VQY3_MICEH|nr:TetR/AcrR family transcriptional regulator [Micromonospora echinofusca]MBO4206916.1 TetR family transcriptional regulator [Micromonospora echinofusca]
MVSTKAYHHGDLRRALLAAAAEAIGESGPAALSLRDLARRVGVSHAAPTHHFGDKAGLLTALAAQGFDLLAEELRRSGTDLLEAGVGYVRFAVRHRAHFEVMFAPGLYRRDDPEVTAARARSTAALQAVIADHPGVDQSDPQATRLATWSVVHGFVTLWLSGALPAEVGTDPEAAARTVIPLLFH